MAITQKSVEEFHRAFDLPIRTTPTLPPMEERGLRVTLIQEELDETDKAFAAGDLVGVADGIGDLLYVVLGAAVACGLDADRIFAEVHRSNMTKIGGTKRADGKLIKPATYSPVDLSFCRPAEITDDV